MRIVLVVLVVKNGNDWVIIIDDCGAIDGLRYHIYDNMILVMQKYIVFNLIFKSRCKMGYNGLGDCVKWSVFLDTLRV